MKLQKTRFTTDTGIMIARIGAPYDSGDAIIARALEVLASRMLRADSLTSSHLTRQYLMLKTGQYQHEVFSVVLLDNQHRVICTEELFRGTIDGAAVYPREVVKLVVQHNAAAVIFSHNHPSGSPEPSQADIHITKRLTAALDLIDVRVLDHVIVGGADCVSLSERGLM